MTTLNADDGDFGDAYLLPSDYATTVATIEDGGTDGCAIVKKDVKYPVVVAGDVNATDLRMVAALEDSGVLSICYRSKEPQEATPDVDAGERSLIAHLLSSIYTPDCTATGLSGGDAVWKGPENALGTFGPKFVEGIMKRDFGALWYLQYVCPLSLGGNSTEGASPIVEEWEGPACILDNGLFRGEASVETIAITTSTLVIGVDYHGSEEDLMNRGQMVS
eukprot:g14864.t1